jgi:hypothetical protein
MENAEFKIKLENWAREVVDYCNKTAIRTDIDKTFYAFQKLVLPFREESRELLVIGINPHGSWTFEDQWNKPIWKLEGKRMTTKGLLMGNPYFTTSQEWDIFKLSKLTSVKSILDKTRSAFRKYVFMPLGIIFR